LRQVGTYRNFILWYTHMRKWIYEITKIRRRVDHPFPYPGYVV